MDEKETQERKEDGRKEITRKNIWPGLDDTYPIAYLVTYGISPEGEYLSPIRENNLTLAGILQMGGARIFEVTFSVAPEDLLFEIKIFNPQEPGQVSKEKPEIILLQRPLRYTKPMLSQLDYLINDWGLPFPYKKMLGIREAPSKEESMDRE